MVELVDSKHVAASVEIGFVGGATLLFNSIMSRRAEPRPFYLIVDEISSVYQSLLILARSNVRPKLKCVLLETFAPCPQCSHSGVGCQNVGGEDFTHLEV